MKKTIQKGFTLIELLIVVALIAILMTVVLVSINASRSKGTDSAIKKQLLEARNQAEVYYHNNSSTYTNVCSSGTGNINLIVTRAAEMSIATLVINGAAQTATTTNCNSSATGYAVSTKLKTPTTTTYLCVDATNKGLQTTTPLGAGSVTCQ
jgi:prepilin-type N-terminal cleavage/methylation domain-containing protein